MTVAVFYVMATCGSLFFSKIRMMVVFGAANLAILLLVDAVKRYAFTSVWCAYAAVASVIILVYFWRSTRHRPFLYSHPRVSAIHRYASINRATLPGDRTSTSIDLIAEGRDLVVEVALPA